TMAARKVSASTPAIRTAICWSSSFTHEQPGQKRDRSKLGRAIARYARDRIARARIRARDSAHAGAPRALYDRRRDAWRLGEGICRYGGWDCDAAQSAARGTHHDDRVEDEFSRSGAIRYVRNRRVHADSSRQNDDGVANASNPRGRETGGVG